MENPVEHIDLGLVNYTQHPENPKYIVFRFVDPVRAEDFENELVKNKIWFERGLEHKKQISVHLFGIHSQDFKRVEKINYLVEARHKKPLVQMAFFRWALVIFGLSAITLAIVGFCSAPQKIKTEVSE